ncbi:MAG: hypothetical protein JWM81_402 [Candidatus Saccharibacteria bacterium]|nr:hypothetical protein [Candidatus Saccharibacteria bacterium]
MITKFRVLQRVGYTMAAVALLVGVAYPVFRPKTASAAQLLLRGITLSDSGVSGGTITTGVGSGTGVTYQVKFTTTTAADSLIIDFCSQNPIIGDTCTVPTAMVTSGVGLAGVSGDITSPGWAATSASAGHIELAKGSGSTAAAGVQSFNLTGITNTSTLGTFYARIYTYSDATFGSSTTAYTLPTAPGNYKDYGGIALSTNQIITITARVQEQLTFCVSGTIHSSWTTHGCDSTQAADAPALTLGHGTPTPTLDSTAIDTGSVYSQISTNATAGATIAMRNSNTTCGGLSANGGTSCDIPAIGTGGYVIGTMVIGTAAFGMSTGDGTPDTNGTGTLTADANYKSTGANTYGMDTETTGDTGSVIGTFGDPVASSTAPLYRMDSTYTFAAVASLTTPAGIYTANIDLIATGKF